MEWDLPTVGSLLDTDERRRHGSLSEAVAARATRVDGKHVESVSIERVVYTVHPMQHGHAGRTAKNSCHSVMKNTYIF